jgi:hypothetical protein
METGNKISTWKIITNDKVTYYASILIILVLVVYIMAAFSQISAMPWYTISATVVILLSSLIIALRVMKIKSILQNGQMLNGTIIAKGIHRGQGNLSLNFAVDGKPYQSCATTPINRFSSTLKTGDEITVIVDPKNPQLAILKDLFIK